MEFRASFKDRLRRTRSSIFSFGSQKPNIFYNFRESHNPSPLIERRCLSSELEKEIQYACYRLQRNIERGIPSRDIRQRPEETESQPTVVRDVGNKPRPQSSSLPPTFRSQKDRHDSGIGLEVHQPMTDKVGVSERVGSGGPKRPCSYDPYYAPSSIPSSKGPGQFDMPYSSGDTLVGNDRVSPDRQTTTSTVQQSSIGPKNTENDAYSDTFLDSDANSTTGIASRLSRPPVASRLVRKKRFENLHGVSMQESQAGTGISNGGQPSTRHRYSWLPRTGIRPASTAELGSSCHRETASEAVVIDSNDLPHAMTAAEEKARQRDLQQAVREKMYTGRIGLRPAFTSINNNQQASALPCLDHSHEGKASGQAPKRKSILHKLSFLGFGKQKDEAPRNKDTVGFSRIVEVV